MAIRPARPEDASAIADIHVSGWRAAYRGIVPQGHLDSLSLEKRKSYWAEAITKEQPQVLVAERGDGIVGWVAFDHCRDAGAPANAGEIWAIYVAPSYWGNGVGRELFTRALNELRQRGFNSISLWVLADNDRACRLYLAAGLRPESSKQVEIGGALLEERRFVAILAS